MSERTGEEGSADRVRRRKDRDVDHRKAELLDLIHAKERGRDAMRDIPQHRYQNDLDEAGVADQIGEKRL